jgi:hypothetical protein
MLLRKEFEHQGEECRMGGFKYNLFTRQTEKGHDYLIPNSTVSKANVQILKYKVSHHVTPAN